MPTWRFQQPELLDALAHTLSHPKFADRIKGFGTSVDALMARYAALVSLVTPAKVPRVVANDPDDDQVIAAAATAQAAAKTSQASFAHVWDNGEDAADDRM